MLKKFILISMCLMALPTVAGNCEGGIEIDGSENGHWYCVSNITMNWWSAHSWCRAQGRTLATLTQACNGNAGRCYNLSGKAQTYSLPRDYAWTATPVGTGEAYVLSMSHGAIAGGIRSFKGYVAICY